MPKLAALPHPQAQSYIEKIDMPVRTHEVPRTGASLHMSKPKGADREDHDRRAQDRTTRNDTTRGLQPGRQRTLCRLAGHRGHSVHPLRAARNSPAAGRPLHPVGTEPALHGGGARPGQPGGIERVGARLARSRGLRGVGWRATDAPSGIRAQRGRFMRLG
ncbi:protein of unknown function [Paraburkholderia kururiensis]